MAFSSRPARRAAVGTCRLLSSLLSSRSTVTRAGASRAGGCGVAGLRGAYVVVSYCLRRTLATQRANEARRCHVPEAT